MKKIFVSAILSLVIFSSCKKEGSDCQTTVATLAGTYRVTAIAYTAPGIPGSTDILATFDACEKDDLYILNANGTFAYQDAGTTCTPGGNYSGSWSLSGNIVTIDGEAATIQSFDCDRLVIYASGGMTAGDKVTSTLEKQ